MCFARWCGACCGTYFLATIWGAFFLFLPPSHHTLHMRCVTIGWRHSYFLLRLITVHRHTWRCAHAKLTFHRNKTSLLSVRCSHPSSIFTSQRQLHHNIHLYRYWYCNKFLISVDKSSIYEPPFLHCMVCHGIFKPKDFWSFSFSCDAFLANFSISNNSGSIRQLKSVEIPQDIKN